MPENRVTKYKNCWIISQEGSSNEIDSDWFEDSYWLNQGRLLGASSGRGSAWMVKSESDKMMLRHYYRGGLPAKFIKDKYFWMGLNNTRSFSEYRLLQLMNQLALPVPEAIAAQACKSGAFYQANILIKYIVHDSTFAGLLNSDSNHEIWEHVGKTIALFHNNGINHADLNANNILVNNDKIYLIDFDHSKQCTINSSWQSGNINRLKRSIDKLSSDEHHTINNSKWQKLLTAYNKEIK